METVTFKKFKSTYTYWYNRIIDREMSGGSVYDYEMAERDFDRWATNHPDLLEEFLARCADDDMVDGLSGQREKLTFMATLEKLELKYKDFKFK